MAPPFGTSARRSDWAEALQFLVLALVAPRLLVASEPWRPLGLGNVAATLAEARRRHPERLRSAAIVGAALACLVAWRTAAAVDALHAGGWPLAVEAISLTAAGTALWLEMVASAPLAPRSARPLRMAIAAVSMWTVWILAYMIAMSPGDWYPAYRHTPGHGLGVAADQQITAGVMWLVAGACFVPLIFSNLLAWLRSEEDADHELHRLVREERRRVEPPRPSL